MSDLPDAPSGKMRNYRFPLRDQARWESAQVLKTWVILSLRLCFIGKGCFLLPGRYKIPTSRSFLLMN